MATTPHDPANLRISRRSALKGGAALFAAPLLAGVPEELHASEVPPVQATTALPTSGATENWAKYAGTNASSKYSPLSQIGPNNFSQLKVAWKWQSVDLPVQQANPQLQTWAWECTPLMIDGVLYVSTSLSQAAAVDAASGKTLWVYDPETWKNGTPANNGFVHRGVAYWANGEDRRILFGTGDGYLICLHAKDGKLVRDFGDGGRIDLTQGLGREVNRKLYGVSSPPVICRDVVVMGSKVNDISLAARMPPGDVRGFDVRTGKLRWTFHSIPKPGEFGYDTWQDGSAEKTGAANVWTMMSADDELGYVYLPFGTSSDDHYGVNRPGNGLFGDSLVCVDVTTGKRVWHFQMVHHGLWDYDLPCAPNLIDVKVDGRPVQAVAQVSKQGFCYVFDRTNGKPLWPMEDRPVPQSTIPGEKTSAMQPFPTKPKPFDRQGVTPDDINDLTPALHQRALAVLEKYNYGPLFTPPSFDKPTIEMPGIAGGASWSGAAVDPDTGMYYNSSVTLPYAATLPASSVPNTGHIGKLSPVDNIQGVPLWKPPYGRVTAIDMNTGEHQWVTPVGDLAAHTPLLQNMNLPLLGRADRGHLLVTKTMLVVGQEGSTQRENNAGPEQVPKFEVVDPKLAAYDKATGKLMGEVALPRNASAAPMTYLLNGKQYLLVATGGANLVPELIAFTLA